MSSCYAINRDILLPYVSYNPATIRELLLNDCYWIDPDLLTEIILKLPQLSKLSVHGTKLKSSLLVTILQACPKITELSAGFDGFDQTFWKEEPDKDDETFKFVENSVFIDASDSLNRLKSLTLFGDLFCPVMFSTILW